MIYTPGPSRTGCVFVAVTNKYSLPVVVAKDTIGHKLGEFAHTKKRFAYR